LSRQMMQSTAARANNQHTTAGTETKFVSPFLNETHDESDMLYANSQNMMAAHPAVDNNTNNNAMGLRAASHVSMDNTPQAHEYQPTCPCMDCQVILNHFTQYEILDAYVTQHMAYENQLTAMYGFVPCIGSPFGNVAVRRDPHTGQAIGDAVTATSLFFHFHSHTMNPVPLDIKAKSLNRFYELRYPNHQQHAQQPRSAVGNSYRHFNNNHSNNDGVSRQSAKTQHRNMPAPRSATMNNCVASGFATHSGKHMNADTNMQFYTPYDAQLAAASVAFTEAAQLGR